MRWQRRHMQAEPEVNYMDKYTVPELEIISFDVEDIITTSDSDVLDKQ